MNMYSPDSAAFASDRVDYDSKTARIYMQLAVTACLVEAFIIARFLTGSLDTVTAIGLHIGFVVLTCLLFALDRFRGDARLGTMVLLLVLLGPLGCLVILASGIAHPKPDSQDQTDWTIPGTYLPPSTSETYYDTIAQDRRQRPSRLPSSSLEEIFLFGDLDQQQQALSAISRHYQPTMFPAIKLALTSDRPAVRVQASAVYAKLRGSFAQQAKALLLTGEDHLSEPEALIRDRACKDVAASGFVAPAIATQLLALGHQETVLRPRHGNPLAGGKTPRPGNRGRHARTVGIAPPALKRYSCGGIA